jgi:hypothetical protein
MHSSERIDGRLDEANPIYVATFQALLTGCSLLLFIIWFKFPRRKSGRAKRFAVDFSLIGSSALVTDIRKWLALFLESKMVQHCLSGLILFDSATVFLECVVDAIIDDRKDVPHTWLHIGFALAQFLELLNVVLLVLFVTELLLLVFALGARFFEKAVYVCDFCIVSSSLGVDLYKPLLGKKGEHAISLLLRVWRIFRIVASVYMVMDERRQEAVDELEKLRDENALLGARLRKLGDTYHMESYHVDRASPKIGRPAISSRGVSSNLHLDPTTPGAKALRNRIQSPGSPSHAYSKSGL